ncbi:thioredoxin family protein [Peptoniphilaceae bacterium SGI.131]
MRVITEAQYNDILQVQDQILYLIDFSADFCNPCKMQNSVLDQLDKLKGDRVSIVKLDIDQNYELSDKLDIEVIPTLFFVKNGQLLERIDGFRTLKSLEDKVESFQKNIE